MNMEGKILSICVSSKKGTKKNEVHSALFSAEWGIKGDAHAGKWHRQVSLLSSEDIDTVREIIPDLKPGAFAENIATEGIDLDQVKIGDKVLIRDEVVLQVTQLGKKCHSGCEIQKLTGDCIMPKKGIFCKVLTGGHIEINDSIKIQKQRLKNSTHT